ncbi:MAG: type II secretion system protein GspG [Kiritimatiellae bacterium]|nr:type II secretion system protein GspG [Kiritimatiellia bacterium]
MKNKSGFTLVELLVVISIIGILAGIVLGMSGGAQANANRKKAESEIERISAFVTSYQMEYGRVPGFPQYKGSTSEATKELKKQMAGANHELKELTDPWGDSYQYRPTSEMTFCLWSFGGDEKNSGKYIGEPYGE